jgi:Protein of unknown function (DUF3365)
MSHTLACGRNTSRRLGLSWGRALLIASAALALAGAGPMDLPEYQRAKALAARIVEDTRTLLDRELQTRGPAEALRACSAVALDLARRHEQEGWRVRRVSDRVRNPGDTPEPYEAAVLRRFAELKARGEPNSATEHVEVVTEASRQYLWYLRPIAISGPVCLNCHGPTEQLAADVKAALKTFYPNDQATGYRLGDLRGAVSVKIPLLGTRR